MKIFSRIRQALNAALQGKPEYRPIYREYDMRVDAQYCKEEVLKFTNQLKTLGAAKAMVSFSGSGDEGFTEAVELLDDTGAPIRVKPPSGLQQAMDRFVPAGYECNDGGGGQIIFNVDEAKIKVTQFYYVGPDEEDEGDDSPAETEESDRVLRIEEGESKEY